MGVDMILSVVENIAERIPPSPLTANISRVLDLMWLNYFDSVESPQNPSQISSLPRPLQPRIARIPIPWSQFLLLNHIIKLLLRSPTAHCFLLAIFT